MPIKLIHVSDIHFGSGESHGRVNPQTGLNVRFEDFAEALSKVVDFTLEKKADIFLFSGDAYKTASPEPVYQKAFAKQLRRLSAARVPTVLLVGNHDQILKGTQSHSMSVFESLEVPGVTVIEKPQLLKIKTKNGKLQLLGIPHVTRHLLMTHEKYADSTSEQINKVLVKHVESIIQDFCGKLNSSEPAVLTAHMMVDLARAGAEQDLMVGYAMTFPLSMLCDERLDYVALGHVHAHQVLRKSHPLIAYAGSLERVDFSEENEDKGFIEADIERGQVSYRFHSISPRPFITVEADLSEQNDPEETLFGLAQKEAKAGAVFRIKYRIQESRISEINEDRLRASLPQLLSLRFKADLINTERPRRLPEVNEKAVLKPLEALERYLAEVYPEKKEALVERARKLMEQLESEN